MTSKNSMFGFDLDGVRKAAEARREVLREELRELCKEEGCSQNRMARFGVTLMEVLAARTPEDAVVKVRATAWEVLSSDDGTDKKYAWAANGALGFGSGAPTLTERRAALLASGDVSVTHEQTLRRWEQTGLDLIARRLAYQYWQWQSEPKVESLDKRLVAIEQKLERVLELLEQRSS